MRRPAWCTSCRRAFQAKSRKQRLCPACAVEPAESSDELPVVEPLREDDPLANSLAPGQDPLGPPPSVIIDDPWPLPTQKTPSAPPPPVAAEEERFPCPRCAEKILAEAQVCRFCGHDFAEAARERFETQRRNDREWERAQREKSRPLGLRLRSSGQVRAVEHRERVEPRFPPFLALVLSFAVPGLGQFCMGDVVKGFVWLLGAGLVIYGAYRATGELPVAVLVQIGAHFLSGVEAFESAKDPVP